MNVVVVWEFNLWLNIWVIRLVHDGGTWAENEKKNDVNGFGGCSNSLRIRSRFEPLAFEFAGPGRYGSATPSLGAENEEDEPDEGENKKEWMGKGKENAKKSVKERPFIFSFLEADFQASTHEYFSPPP